MPNGAENDSRTLALIVGPGRSGTSTLAVTLQTLGMHVPKPEVEADATNPKGFGEPQWVVDLHNQLLREANVQTSDARPSAWLDVSKHVMKDGPRDLVHGWLESQFRAEGNELVIKDPRSAWFLGLWKSAAIRCQARPIYLTMLRPVTEVVGSKQQYYSNSPFGELNRVAGWVNMMLHTERATRGADRAFIRYQDLLSDWTVPVYDVGHRFGIRAVTMATANDIRHVHDFIDPDLRRVRNGWDDMDVPRALRELADETWDALSKLSDDPSADHDGSTMHDTLDQLRAEYTHLYQGAEAIAESTTVAEKRAAARGTRGVRAPRRGAKAHNLPDRIAARIPHDLRAKIPPGVRRRGRKLARRLLNR